MSVVASGRWTLPDSPYAMWVRDELAAYLRIPEDGTRVEVIGGEFVVSPAPVFTHAVILSNIQRAVDYAEFTDPSFPWRVVQGVNVDLVEIGDGYVPDLVVLHRDTVDHGCAEDVRHLYPQQVNLVVEVTSPSNAYNDREPVLSRRMQATKWNGYARGGVPHYLLVDRDPERPGITLFGEPDRGAGTYGVLETWKFGETVSLPEPFRFEIPTDRRRPWSD
ncbi:MULTISPECIES: Uma2 family endonuclease [unclassified Kitasatospora]|uniref:Uma2 family endonuclease n=1 Tax=unclassified Kitasatospora TaxID=2633591 RepID=UPI003822E462